ncbi:MAG: glycoside hydrolase 43 family protein [Prolixibacteraceae bacterium]|jgi:beta-xylosidase|nr:glycoside hydrolase 43 family protein [Prolixibacteraceae bacterium]
MAKKKSNKAKTIYHLATMVLVLLSLANISYSQNRNNGVWNADNDNETYTNPILHADYSDPDVCKVGNDFYLTASSFNCVPGLPILHSTDLVNWEIITYALPELYNEMFERPQHGNGVWAPAIRYHNNEFYIYWGDPDLGIFMVKAKKAKGPWSKPHLVHEAKGWIDPCPLWDENGKAYLVHAFAGSRAGIKSILVINEMSPDGLSINPQASLVFDGHENHPTIEGPKLYKRNDYYYIFAPAGGVKPGWQTVLRSKNIYGPYEEKVVLHQGNTNINGPHQGGYVELDSGESWFIHFQDKDAYGRIVHLQPMQWKNNWPQIGIDVNNDGIGEPVHSYNKPKTASVQTHQQITTSDEFNSNKLGLQWQWHASPKPEWYFTSELGYLRLNTVLFNDEWTNLWDVPNLLLQKFPKEKFSAITKLTLFPKQEGDKAGLLIMGEDYAYIAIEQLEGKTWISFNTCYEASKGNKEKKINKIEINPNTCFLKVAVRKGGLCQFAFSEDGITYTAIGTKFTASAGRWIGAKVGIFAQKAANTNDSGYADFDWFRVE